MMQHDDQGQSDYAAAGLCPSLRADKLADNERIGNGKRLVH